MSQFRRTQNAAREKRKRAFFFLSRCTFKSVSTYYSTLKSKKIEKKSMINLCLIRNYDLSIIKISLW